MVTSIKNQLVKGNARTIIFRDYSKFNMDAFKEDLDESLSNRNVCEYTLFQNIFVHTLDKQVRIKKKKYA